MKILICSDGSEQAESAVRLGAAIAGGCQAEVTLLGIIELPAESKTVTDSLARGLALLQDKKVRTESITRTGKAIEEIVKRTQEAAYDLVVVGAVRKQSRGAFWMSSKSYKIIKEVTPPVMVVAGKSASLKRILICSGGKRYIENAVRFTGEIAHGVGAQVSILHVLPETPAIYAHLPRMMDDLDELLRSKSELGTNLREAKETLEALQVGAEVRLRRGAVLEQILREVHEGDYDLVVVGSTIAHGLTSYALGDVTREVVNRTSKAVLVVRTTERAPESQFKLRMLLGRSK